jgi:hypothetical protein
MGLEMSTEPTPMSRPLPCATKLATSSFEIITLRGATQAVIRLLSTFAASIAKRVASTGISVVGVGILVQRRSVSKMGSCSCRTVGCCAQASGPPLARA